MIYELIDVDKLFRSKSQAVKILDSVSVKIPEGKITVVSGPSGSGKSTLLNILFGIEDVTHGEVRYRGELLEEVEDLSSIWRTDLSYLTQVPQTLEYLRVGGLGIHEPGQRTPRRSRPEQAADTIPLRALRGGAPATGPLYAPRQEAGDSTAR